MEKNFATELRSVAQAYDPYTQNEAMIKNYINTLIHDEILPKAKWEATQGKFFLEYTYNVDYVSYSMHHCELPRYFSKADALKGAAEFKKILVERLRDYGLTTDRIDIYTIKRAKDILTQDGRRWIFDYKNLRISW